MTSTHIPTTDALEALHLHYVEAVNSAVGEDRMDLVRALADEYENAALALMVTPDLRRAA